MKAMNLTAMEMHLAEGQAFVMHNAVDHAYQVQVATVANLSKGLLL